MSAAWVLVWLGASTPTADQRLALESYELAHGLSTRTPTEASGVSIPYPERAARRVEAALEHARTLSGSLQDAEASAQVARAKHTLLRHPELPQAAWQMAETLRLEARLLARDPESRQAAEAALRAATILDGGRALGVDEAALSELDAALPPEVSFRVDLPSSATLSVDGAAPRASIKSISLPPGLHHVRVTRQRRQLYSAWVELTAQSATLPLPISSGERCSHDDFAALRRAPDDSGAIGSVSCERWLMARPAPGPARNGAIQVRRCEGSKCGAWVSWNPTLGVDFAGPAQGFDHDAGWPDWATYLIVGASAVAITSVVLWQLGTFESAEPGKKKWVYEAPLALTF